MLFFLVLFSSSRDCQVLRNTAPGDPERLTEVGPVCMYVLHSVHSEEDGGM